jgi:GNAT superfamily N-acetyltransferase
VILTSEAALTAISTSRIEASLALGRTSLGVVEAAPDLCWSISGIPVASFNGVVRCRIGPDPDRRIDDVQRQFAARAMPFVWWVKGREEDLEKRLRNHGLDFESEESSGMALGLTSLPQVRSGPLVVSVQRITERPDLRTWFATLLASFDATADDWTLERATDVFAELSATRASGWHFYLARIHGRPVGTSALHLGAAAGLYSVGTLPSRRRQGIGAALSVRALTDARSAGYGIATLTASELGARLYQALGFKEYCRYREYVWRPLQKFGSTTAGRPE